MKNKYSSDLLKLIEEFQINNVKFIVCGGIACVLHGVERATVDIDLSVEMKTKNLKKIIEISKKIGLKPRISEPVENLLDEKIRRKWINEKGALTYTFISEKTPLQVDIFINYPKSYEELLKDCDIFDIEGYKIAVSSKKDLLFAKKIIKEKREKDLFDIKELEKLIEKNKK